jgi:hypothetical protein
MMRPKSTNPGAGDSGARQVRSVEPAENSQESPRPQVLHCCGACRFFHPAVTMADGYSDRAGECRRSEPQISRDSEASWQYMRAWPIVWREDWCGKFEQMPCAAELAEGPNV